MQNQNFRLWEINEWGFNYPHPRSLRPKRGCSIFPSFFICALCQHSDVVASTVLVNSLVPLGVRVSAHRIISEALYMCETGFWIFKLRNILMKFEYTYHDLNTRVYIIANTKWIFYTATGILGLHRQITFYDLIVDMYNLTIWRPPYYRDAVLPV